MGIFHVVLILATFTCSLVAGFLLAFAVVVMPGIRKLGDAEYIRAFQVMDAIIQNNQPGFVLVWLGSIVTLIASVVLGIGQLDGAARLLMGCATVIYLLGVQLPTFTINIPLNNRIQGVDVDVLDEAARKAARRAFEPRWNRWNVMRTVLSSLVSVLLLILLLRL